MDVVRKKRVQDILYLAAEFDDNMDPDVFKLIAMSNICRIFESKQLRDVIGGILSLYALMNKTVLEDETFRNALLDEGIQLNELKIRNKHDLSNCIKFLDPKLNAKFLHSLNAEGIYNDYAPIRIRRVSNIFKDRFSNLSFPIGFVIAFTGLCLSLMCKKLTKYNHFAWVRQKWKCFLAIVGLNNQFSECGPSYHLMPGLNTCCKVYSFFKLHHELRRRLYLGIMKLSWESGLWGNMCRAVLRFSKGLEMNHIVLMNTYVLQDHPELSLIEELKPEFRKLQTAFRVFRKENIPEEQWPYIRIMSKFSIDIWNKKKFPMLNYLSVQIGKRIRTDLGDYHCELSSEMQEAANKIMSDVIHFDSASQIVHPQPENASTAAAVSSNMRDEEFTELFEISDILEKSIYSLSGIRNFHDDDNDLNLLPNIIPCTEVKCFKMSTDVDTELHKIVCMLNISRIFQNECLTEIIGGILSIFAAVDSETWSSEDCQMPLKTHGFELNEILLESANDLVNHFVFENEELNDLFLKFYSTPTTINPDSVVIKHNSVVSHLFTRLFTKSLQLPNTFAYIGMYILPIFKHLEDNNHTNWFRHKWETFCRVTSSHSTTFSELLLPSLSTCFQTHSFFQSNYELRTVLFVKITKFLKLPNPASIVFHVICHNAKESEITHIYLINHFLLQHGKHYLKMKELKPELLRFMRALENVQCVLPSYKNWLYIKLISHPNEVEFLNKNNFPLLLYLSESIRDSKNQPKYAGVRTVTEFFKKVEKTVKMFGKFYSKASSEESIRKYFQLNFPNGDLLSTLKDEQLKQMTINSLLLSACHERQLGNISDERKKEILDMSIEKVKEMYEHFKMSFDLQQNVLQLQQMFQVLYGHRNVTVTVVEEAAAASNSGGDALQMESTENDELLNDPSQYDLESEDELLNDVGEDQNELFEDEWLSSVMDDWEGSVDEYDLYGGDYD